MSGIEMYIKENIGEFDAYPVPEGSRNAFLKKVKAEKSRGGLRTVIVTISSMAAAAAIAFLLVPGSMAHDIEKQHRKLVSETAPEELDEIQNTIRMVTSDAIPLEEQLPEEMKEESRKKILKEYYDIKYKALETILEQYTGTY